MKNNYCVYIHIFSNGKNYIGITRRNPIKRWGFNGYGYRLQTKFYNAILKYGWDNIKHEILFTNLTKEEAEEKEIELIKKYNSIENGYNVENGGSVKGKHSEETKSKISKANKGKPKSDITKLKISMSNKGKVRTEEIKHHLKEIAKKPKSEIGKQHIREAKIGNKNPMYGKKSTEKQLQARIKATSKKVIQYDLKGNLIKIYDSLAEAQRQTNINSKHISRSCRTKYNAGGFKWCYVN